MIFIKFLISRLAEFSPVLPRRHTGEFSETAAEMALAGIDSAIPADEVIWSMKRVGDAMSPALKETAEGGLAATPTGRKLHDLVFGPESVPGGCSGCTGCHS